MAPKHSSLAGYSQGKGADFAAHDGMGKFIRRLLIVAGVVFGLIVIVAVGVGLFFDVNSYKPQIEAAVKKSTGMDLRLAGKASLKILPIRIAVRDVHLAQKGKEVFASKEVQVVPQLTPFLMHRQVVVDRVEVLNPKIHIEKAGAAAEKKGKGTKVPSKTPEEKKQIAGGTIRAVNIKDGEVTYVDPKNKAGNIEVKGLDIHMSKIAWNGGDDLIKSISFDGDVKAKSLKAASYFVTDIQSGLKGNHGMIHANGTQAKIFGGEVRGNASADLRTPTPKMKLDQKATKIDLAQIMAGGKSRVTGTADGDVNLTASGNDLNAIAKSALGKVSIRGRDIKLAGIDIDAIAGKLSPAQGMGLASIGSALIVGPIAPAAGQAAGIVGGAAAEAQGNSTIRELVSDWNIGNGLAQTEHVYFSTDKTKIGFKGAINIVDRTYQNFYIATLDPQGCAKQKIKVEGPLASPKPTTGEMIGLAAKSLTAPETALGGKIGGEVASIFGGGGAKNPPPSNAKQEAPKSCEKFV